MREDISGEMSPPSPPPHNLVVGDTAIYRDVSGSILYYDYLIENLGSYVTCEKHKDYIHRWKKAAIGRPYYYFQFHLIMN